MAQRQLVKGYIGLLIGKKADDLTFQYNPKEVRRNARATYANNAAALSDFPRTRTNQGQPIEWIRNEAEDFSVDLIFHEDGDRDIEQQLQKLDDFMKPDTNTKQPQDLILVMGPRTDRVRILEKDVTETLYTPDLHVQEARVSLKFKSMTSRSAGGI